MKTILLENISDALFRMLEVQAAAHNRSVEAECLEILSRPPGSGAGSGLGQGMRAGWRGAYGNDLDDLRDRNPPEDDVLE